MRCACVWVLVVCVVAARAAPALEKPRLIVLTDIGGDPDDQQSMVRLMSYANEFDIEGLIASASGTPGELKRDVVQPQLIREIVQAYGAVRPNQTGQPAARDRIACGRAGYGSIALDRRRRRSR